MPHQTPPPTPLWEHVSEDGVLWTVQDNLLSKELQIQDSNAETNQVSKLNY